MPIDNITQYEKLLSYSGLDGVRAGVIIWLIEKDIEFYIPVKEVEKMRKDGKKSIGLKSIEEGYNIKIIPTEKKRVFLKADYSVLESLVEGE